MSTINRPQTGTLPPLIAGQRLDRATFHERYEAMPTDTRAELIGGVVHMPSPMSVDHGDNNVPLVVWLDRYAESTPGVRANINSTLLLDELGEPQPDASLRITAECGGQAHIERDYLAGAPELVVEIARSSRHIDLGAKKDDYERAGVCEYIVVELDPNKVHLFIRRGDQFAGQEPGPDGLFRSEVFPGLWLDAEALFAEDRARIRAALEQSMATAEHANFVARLAANRL
ncbi:MAG TPA: Uma2 family endonuclease [Isosphaeraceae bacterium]|jgi:Uma2 family endonuclease|nr:Uma2 family endonuclease [Isosphaeraceae bacterium]